LFVVWAPTAPLTSTPACTTSTPSHDATDTLGESEVVGSYPDLLAAARALLHDRHPYKQIVFVDDRGDARFLTEREEEFVDVVASKVGRETVELDGDDAHQDVF
jgi:hypothetical protein